MRETARSMLVAVGAGCATGGCLFLVAGILFDVLAPSKVPATLVFPPLGVLLGAVVGALAAAARAGVLLKVLALACSGAVLAVLIETCARAFGWR